MSLFTEEPPESALNHCSILVFIKKLSECNQFNSASVNLTSFVHFKYFYITWIVFSLLSYFCPFFNKNLLQWLKLFHKHVLILTNLHNITLFLFRHLKQLVNFCNSLYCTIVLGRIQRFIVFFFQLLHIQTSGALQCW